MGPKRDDNLSLDVKELIKHALNDGGTIHRVNRRQVFQQQLPAIPIVPAIKQLAGGGSQVNATRVQMVRRLLSLSACR